MKPHIKRVEYGARYLAELWSSAARGYVPAHPTTHLWGVFRDRRAAKPIALTASFDTLAKMKVFNPRAC